MVKRKCIKISFNKSPASALWPRTNSLITNRENQILNQKRLSYLYNGKLPQLGHPHDSGFLSKAAVYSRAAITGKFEANQTSSPFQIGPARIK